MKKEALNTDEDKSEGEEDKSEDIIVEGGNIDKTYTRYNGFNARMNTEY